MYKKKAETNYRKSTWRVSVFLTDNSLPSLMIGLPGASTSRKLLPKCQHPLVWLSYIAASAKLGLS